MGNVIRSSSDNELRPAKYAMSEQLLEQVRATQEQGIPVVFHTAEILSPSGFMGKAVLLLLLWLGLIVALVGTMLGIAPH